jgi:hypothetical protein
MEILQFTIAAGETKRFEKSGRYIEILDSTYPIDLYLSDASGGRVDYGRGIYSGTFLAGFFQAFELYSATAQTLQLLLTEGTGGTRRQPGIVRVVDEITDSLTVVNFAPSLAAAGYAATPLLAPASNTKGAIVRFCSTSAQGGAGGSSNVGIVAAKSTPSSYSVPLQRLPFLGSFAAVGASLVDKTQLFNKLIPPGWGIYGQVDIQGATAVNAAGQVGYELML